MSSELETCPSEAELEAHAQQRGDSRVARHVAVCETCRGRIKTARDDNEFLSEFASALDKAPRAARFPSIRGYRIVEEIHRGGQGVVYKARQESTRRWVAIKMLLGGPVATPRQLHRFEREIELIAVLDHPHIVTVYESGTADGQPYFAMEYVRGTPLRISDEPPTRAQIKPHLERFKQICAAVAYAHQRGIIHRDLKPGNILVDANGRPRIVDFGLARVLGEPQAAAGTQATRTGEFVGTFGYCAPEQLEGAPERVDTRTDVYALGVILFELLTGSAPYEMGVPVDQLIASIKEHSPKSPSALNPAVDDELETIVLTCLAKEPDRRYRSAGELLADLESYATGRAILAKRDSTWYLLRKTARRHRSVVLGVVLAGVSLVGFSLTMSVLYRRAQRAEGRAVENAAELRTELRHSTIQRARLTGNVNLSTDLLWRERLQDAPPLAETDSIPTSPVYWALWEQYRRHPCRATAKIADDRVVALGTTPGEPAQLHAVCGDGIVRSWRIDDPASLEPWRRNADPVVAASHADGMMAMVTDASAVELWDLASRTLIARAALDFIPKGAPAVSPGAERVVFLTPDCGLLTWHPFEQTIVRTALSSDVAQVALGPLPGETYTVSHDGFLQRWDGAVLVGTRETEVTPGGITISPDGQSLALASLRVKVFGTADLTETLSGYSPAIIQAVALTPDGAQLLGGARDAAVRSWGVNTKASFREYRGHSAPISAIMVDARQQWFATGDQHGVVKIWDMAPRLDVTWMPTEGFSNHALAFNPDGSLLVTAGASIVDSDVEPSPVRVWDVRTRTLQTQLAGHIGIVAGVAFAPHGQTLATCGYDSTIRLWDVYDGEQRAMRRVFSDSLRGLSALAFDPRGETLVTAANNGKLAVWNPRADTLRVLEAHNNRIPSLAFHPNGRRLVSASKDKRAIVWDTATWEPLKTLMHSAPVRAAVFSPDGRFLATAGDDSQVTLWDARSYDKLRTLTGHRQHVFTLAFSPDGSLLASGALEGGLLLWDVETGQNLARMMAERRGDHLMAVAFSPDGDTLATGHTHERVGLWDLRYYDAHMAGNVAHQLDRLGWADQEPLSALRWREWAAAVAKSGGTGGWDRQEREAGTRTDKHHD